MKQQWIINRRMVPRSDGQRRWDQVYQHLLLWTPASGPHPHQEVHDAGRHVCPRLDGAADPGADDRATSKPVA